MKRVPLQALPMVGLPVVLDRLSAKGGELVVYARGKRYIWSAVGKRWIEVA